MHTTVIAVSVALCIAGYVFILRAINEQIQIQHEINLKLPAHKQFEPTFWGYGTHEKFRELQREFLPASPRPRRLRIFRLIGFGMLACGMLILLMTLNVGLTSRS